jgi:FlaA1/EpsC-like NDP-sugar epimerase
MISTDKAVNPTNVMGASKRLAELMVQAVAGAGAAHAVRVGALRQRAGLQRLGGAAVHGADRRGGPVTVTHPEIVRYFMTIPRRRSWCCRPA